MHKDISPEEKLLSIIKKKPDKPEEAGVEKAEPKESRIEMAARIFDPEILRIFNKYTAVVLSLLAFYLILDIFIARPARNATALISKISASKMPSELAGKPIPTETQNYTYHSNKIAGKNIFSGSPYSQTEGAESEVESGPTLGLVGIVPGDNPQAIIEDTKNQRTYYLIKGQSVNEITIEDISEDKVTLDYKGKKMTLFL